jgi:hypothetical protein
MDDKISGEVSSCMWEGNLLNWTHGQETTILKLSKHDEEGEKAFELEYLRSLTFEERMAMMRKKSKEMLRQMVDRGHRKPFEIVKRS